MEEKLIEAKFSKNILAWAVFVMSLCLIVLGLIWAGYIYSTAYGFDSYLHMSLPYTMMFDSFGDFFAELMCDPVYYRDAGFSFVIYLGLLGMLAAGFFAFEMSKCSLTVTNIKITGKASFGKLVDLPMRQISAVALGSFGRITVATSSGKVHFWFVKNREEVRSVLSDMIGKWQAETTHAQNKTACTDKADELKKYKELLDSGVITQEEFDVKKKQLLGL